MPFGFECEPLLLLPPPHEQMNKSNTSGTIRIRRGTERLPRRRVGRMIPKRATAQSHEEGTRKGRKGVSWAVVRAVLVMFTVKFEAEVALTLVVAGTEHCAPVGAPVQLRATVPLNPVPPIASVYIAVTPACTVSDAELPDATPRPKSVLPLVPLKVAV